MYAATQLKGERGYLGYVLRGCGTEPMTTVYHPTLPGNNQFLKIASINMAHVYNIGNVFLIVLMLLMSVMFLHSYKEDRATMKSDHSVPSTLDNYGIFWGCVTVSFLGNALLNAQAMLVVSYQLTSAVPEFITSGCIVLAQLVVGISASMVVAIFYGRKFNFSVPSIFLLPFVILCCNRAKETSEKVVRCLSIWSILTFLFHVCVRASFVFLALLGRPATVISATLLYILTVFNMVHLLAIFFTIAKAMKRQQQKRKIASVVYELAQALAFLVLFATAVCFGSLIGFAGILANYRTVMNSPYSTISALIAPTFFAVFGWVLRKVGLQWLKTVQSREAAEGTEQELLLPEESVIVNLDREPMVQGKFQKLRSWLILPV